MATPTPTMDQVLAAVVTALSAASATTTVLHFEDRHKSELETIREYRDPATFECDVAFVDADPENVEGKTYGEHYVIYRVEVRHLYTCQDEQEISRIAKHRAELMRRAIENNANVFRVGGQVPLRTPETASLKGRFVDREDSRYYESMIEFSVEARQWA
jgi:hypothetical protein